ncbi:hypothetical protein HH765_004546 [Escherichia coli]|nr:hypothetical protein [Escherichia coli]MXE35227.1 hypothetical protein [Escherichia coli]
MKSHDQLRLVFAETCQNRRAFTHVMQVHENHYIKRAGVAGIRARAPSNNYKVIEICRGYSIFHLIDIPNRATRLIVQS